MSEFADSSTLPYWRIQASQVVAELFPVTPRAVWDALLELRTELLHGTDLNVLLDQFLQCRAQLEADHYLPFYRLRRLMESSLRLSVISKTATESTQHVPLRRVFWNSFRSLKDIHRRIGRDRFEHDLEFSYHAPFDLEVRELTGPV